MTHDVKLGELVTNADAARDALHFAIAPMIAAERLQPGEHVGIVSDDNVQLAGPCGDYSIGIVDPFLKTPVRKGERFWLMLYQNTITSLRHAWTHSAFEGEGVGEVAPVSPTAAIEDRVKAAAEAWLRNCAADLGLDYSTLMDAADGWVKHHDYYVFRDEETPSLDTETFWHSWEKITGRHAPEDRPAFFSCSC